MIEFFKYQGTGNDFVMIDNRDLQFPKQDTPLIKQLCDRKFGIGADGLILLEDDTQSDFKMVYYNADGNESTMCGNGGRCIVAFAKQLGIIDNTAAFLAVDGMHHATIDNELVSLQMIDVDAVENHGDYYFVNTGSPHHITLVEDLEDCDVYNLGKSIRYSSRYSSGGTNVNFVKKINDSTFKIRTYERGVEDETLSCGTGATAVALAMHHTQQTISNHITILVEGGTLTISFTKEKNYKNIFLTGPAQLVFKGFI